MSRFGSLLAKLISQTTLFPGEDVLFEVFFNPASGVLASRAKRAKLIASMEMLIRRYDQEKEYARSAPRRGVEVNTHPTRSRRESLESILSGVDRLSAYNRGRAVLLLAGGDGFHKDALTEIIRRRPKDLDRFILFRLPLGTGNDTPLETDPIKALDILFTHNRPRKDSYLEITTRSGDVDYALNVASYGLDAYVCLLTERWKGRIRGDIYKVMVDLSTLLYDFYHRTAGSKLTVTTPRGDEVIEKRILMNVFGRKGATTYGGGKKILPGEENLLVTGFFGIPGRIMLKGLFMKGGHHSGRFRRVDFYRAEKTLLSYPAPLLMELDGEVRRLVKEDFPVTIELRKDLLTVLN